MDGNLTLTSRRDIIALLLISETPPLLRGTPFGGPEGVRMTTGHDGTEIGVTSVAGVASTPDSQMLAKLHDSADESIVKVFGETALLAVRGPTGNSIAVSGNECNATAAMQKGRKTRSLRNRYGGDVKSSATVYWGLAQEGAIDAQASISTLKTREIVGDTYYHHLPVVSLAASLLNRLGVGEVYDLSIFGKNDDGSRALVHAIYDALNNGKTIGDLVVWSAAEAEQYANCFSVPDRNAEGRAMVVPHCEQSAWDATKQNLMTLVRSLGVPIKAKQSMAFGKGNFGPSK
jgi:hypothetical protein